MQMNFNRRVFRFAAAAVFLLCTACGGQQQSSEAQESTPQEEARAPGAIAGIDEENYPRVDGSTSNLPLIAHLYSAVCGVSLETAEGLVSVSGGTGAAWYNMLYEGADLLIVHEAPDSLKEAWENESGPELEITPVGVDGLVFLVNRQNPVDNLTTSQLQGIYTGEITRWEEVGGEAGDIAPFQRNEESGSQTLFRKLLMDGLRPMEPPTELIPGSMAGLIDDVASFDGSGGAIGYSVYYYASLMYENPQLKLLSVNGVEPSFASIQSGEYPLVNEFFTVIRADEPQDSPARLIRDWLHTEEGKALLVSADYIPAMSSSREPDRAADAEQEAPTAVFGLGLKGEGEKTMAVGDTIGQWTLEDLQVDYFEGEDNVRMLEALFKGNVTIRGEISPSGLLEDAFDFRVAGEDEGEMPQYIAPEMDGKEAFMFLLDIPDELAATVDLAHGEARDCQITISDYRFVFAYMTAPAGATVVELELL